MASAKFDPEIIAHREWIGFVKPIGLVVSAPALVRAGAILDRRDAEGQRLLRECIAERVFNAKEGAVPYLPEFRRFAVSVLGWSLSPKGYAGTAECRIPSELEVPLSDYGETLRPDFAVRELDPQNGSLPWQLLVKVLDPGEDFDHVVSTQGRLEASAHGRMERLLRQTGVPAGLLFNGRTLRLVSAPHGESSGWLDFRVGDMVQTAGRPISTALRLLLGQARLLSLPRAQRLAALLEDSRKFQNEVSEKLAEQVLHALYELLRGFQAAHDASKGELLKQVLAEHPDEVYRALLTVILRLVFLFYAEERDMLPEDETFLRYYSLAGLYERLREDAALFPDTMDQRYGAWAQLIVLFRMIHDGAESGSMRLPKRHGVLFDPDRFKFLEGRRSGGTREIGEHIELPLVPDGTVYRSLEKLVVLEGERISYRALDVEQIGSVYETMMGFRLETATGRSVAIKAQKKQGAPTAVNLEALLAEPAAERREWLEDHVDCELTDTVNKNVLAAATVEDLHAALLPLIDPAATPDLVSKGAMVLQPSEERRRSGSHYTPRVLTEPIVRTTLEPILARLRGADGRPLRPAQILDVKVCDPAMGSGAFLVEACRQLGDALVEAWHTQGELPAIPPDEDEVTFARRLIAQRCLYGVDKNSVAVDLAKMSLWLVTLAKDHPLTFLDHALRHGDSLVGLSRKQIEAFHWKGDAPRFQAGLEAMRVREHVARIAELRKRIREAGEDVPDKDLRELWKEVLAELGNVRLFGDLVMAAFFGAEKLKERDEKRNEYASAVVGGDTDKHRRCLEEWQHAGKPLVPFHWEIEFPEVFDRENSGFDAFVGNPPFAGKNNLIRSHLVGFLDWLKELHPGTHGNADLVAHFFRRCYTTMRTAGSAGLIATTRIGEGDTRATGLSWICQHGGQIIRASGAAAWPGGAAVQFRSVNFVKGGFLGTRYLADKQVAHISPGLTSFGNLGDGSGIGDTGPHELVETWGVSYVGHAPHGAGFILSNSEARQLLRNERNAEVIAPFLIAKDLNDSPSLSASRWIIDFGTRTLAEAEQYPECLEIVRDRVKPYRERNNRKSYREKWWLFGEHRAGLATACAKSSALIACAMTTMEFKFSFVPTTNVFDQTLAIIDPINPGCFAVVDSTVHKLWARKTGATFGSSGAPRYNPKHCFRTFPFPGLASNTARLVEAGNKILDCRQRIMATYVIGLTETYNRFHDIGEHDPEILKLRELHTAMDRAVLDAYGWTDIKTDCEFLSDYEIDEEEWGEKKKPYRHRWPDEVRDEVLARLLELNAEHAKEEARSGASTERKGGKKIANQSDKASDVETLF